MATRDVTRHFETILDKLLGLMSRKMSFFQNKGVEKLQFAFLKDDEKTSVSLLVSSKHTALCT